MNVNIRINVKDAGFVLCDRAIEMQNTAQKKRLNTIPYFTVLGQITSIYRHTKTICSGKYGIIFRRFSGNETLKFGKAQQTEILLKRRKKNYD